MWLTNLNVAFVHAMKQPFSATPDPKLNPQFNRRNAIPEAAWDALASSLGLSKRQVQIVRAVAADDTEFTIAADLGVSMHTVHTHLDRLHRKLGVHSRVELLVLLFAEFLRLTESGAAGLPPVCPRHSRGECPLGLSQPP